MTGTRKKIVKNVVKIVFGLLASHYVLSYLYSLASNRDYVHYTWINQEFKGKRKILLWTGYFGGYKNWQWVFPNKTIFGCQDQSINDQCAVTSDRAAVNDVDTIMFSLEDIDSHRSFGIRPRFPDIGWQSRRKQMWIAVWFESKSSIEGLHYTHIKDLDGRFNATISYRSDSLFDAGFYFHDEFEERSEDFIDRFNWSSITSKAESKKSLAAWIVSHCNTWSQREEYVEEMQQYGKVDIFGKCGPLSLGTNELVDTMSRYKFYLSFENSKCDGYATEKIFRVLDIPVHLNPPVPVVMGPKNSWYEKHLPPNSYIHVDDFNGPKELMDYLFYLNKNHDKYMEYLKWKRNHVLVPKEQKACSLCKVLLNIKEDAEASPFPSIKDFKKFWDNEYCAYSKKSNHHWTKFFQTLLKYFVY